MDICCCWNYFFKKWWMKRRLEKDKKNRPIIRSECEPDQNVINQNEEHLFFGCDDSGNLLLINGTTSSDGSEVYLYLKLKDGRVFTIPDYLATSVAKHSSGAVKISGLSIECLIPYIKWRITFNGLLKGNLQASDENDLQYVTFTFFWVAACDPLDLPHSMSSTLVASALAKDTEHSDALLSLLSDEFQGHDQFGSLRGQLSIEGKTKDDKGPFELNLPGVRQRRWSRLAKGDPQRSEVHMGACKDGSIYVVGAKSFQGHIPQIQFGFLRKANGSVFPIDNVLLPEEAEDNPSSVNVKSIFFEANGVVYNPVVQYEESTSPTFVVGRPISRSTCLKTAGFSLGDYDGYGISIYGQTPSKEDTLMVPITDSASEQQHISHIPSDKDFSKKKLFTSFSEPECQIDSLYGGKGASLGFLTSLSVAERKSSQYPHYIVPNGFVLSTNAYDLQLERHKNLEEATVAVQDQAFKRKPGSLVDTCKQTFKLFKETVIEPSTVQAVLHIFDVLQENYRNVSHSNEAGFRLAVRSSAIGEDSSETSSAGQNDTFLGCSSTDEVLEAVKSCWASLYSHQSVVYRHQNSQPIRTKMAVVIQTMVPSDCAGVLFTHYPLNKNPYKMLITANYGLGESVVSGMVDPDVYIVQRSYRKDILKIVQKDVGQKSHSIHMSEGDDKLAQTEVTAEDSYRFCLTDVQILDLGTIGVHLENCYGSARDIEWAVFNNNIYLLQSRPMTSMNTFSSWELLHEFDTAVMSSEDLSTFANAGEVFPEVITPLTLSTFVRILNKTITENVTQKPESPYYPSITRLSHYRLCFDAMNMFLMFVDKEITLVNKIQGIAMSGHEFMTDDMHKIAIHRHGIGTLRKKMPLFAGILKELWKNKTTAQKLDEFTSKFVGTYDPAHLEKFETAADLFYDLVKTVDGVAYPAKIHGATSKASMFYQIIAFSILAEGNTDLTTEHYSDIGLMLSSCKDVESAEIPLQLEKIATEICSTNKHEEFSLIDPKDGMNWLETNCNEAFKLLNEFLKKHYHRSYKEFELASETWGMRPDTIIEMLQATTKSNGNASIKGKEMKTNDEIIAALKSPKKPSTRKAIRKLLPLCQSSVQIREKSKSNFIAYVHEIRKGFRHLAEMMRHQGLLPHEDLIFYLTQTEIARILQQPCPELTLKAGRRKRLFPEWSKHRFDENVYGVIAPLADFDELNSNGDNVEVIGTPVCEGIVTGRACVLKSFSEVSQIQAGDILVTHSTDIGWSPYFPILSGVVTELGGLISHGAVVAREYGLPCIVGASNATNIFKFGDQIKINAVTGVIIKID